MSAVFEFPVIDESALAPKSAPTAVAIQAEATAVTTVKAAVLSQFKATEPVLQALVARYANVAIDVSTPKGLADAKAARHDLRKNGRFVVQNARDDLKAEINALKPVIESEAERLIAMIKPTEDAYDGPITEREAQLAAEKAEREAKEAARVAAHRAGIEKLASYVAVAQGKTSDQLLTMINAIDAIALPPEQWEEFTAGAEAQKAKTLDALQSLFNVTKNAEAEAVARENQRIENARIAAELAEQQRALAAERAELDRQRAEIAAAAKAKVDAEQKARDEAEAAARQAAEDAANALAAEVAAAALQAVVDATPTEVLADAYGSVAVEELSDDALAAQPEIADEVPHVAARAAAAPGPITFAEPEVPTASAEPTLNLGAINTRFGGVFSLSAAGLAILCIEPAATVKAARLYSERQFIEICDRLVEHLAVVCDAVTS